MSQPIIVTGVRTGFTPGDPPFTYPQRLEWHDFVKDPELVTLYIKALREYMNMSQDIDTPGSYFQVAGIQPLNKLLRIRHSWFAIHTMG
jgi:hypothetical protein